MIPRVFPILLLVLVLVRLPLGHQLVLLIAAPFSAQLFGRSSFLFGD